MASALIDLGVILRMLSERLFTLQSGGGGMPAIPVRLLGEEDPQENVKVWARFEDPAFESIQRQRGDNEPDLMNVRLQFTVFTSEEQQSRHAIGTAATVCRNCFEGQTLVDPPAPDPAVHQVDLTGSTVQFMHAAEGERRIRCAEVVITGVVQRWSGVSVNSFLDA